MSRMPDPSDVYVPNMFQTAHEAMSLKEAALGVKLKQRELQDATESKQLLSTLGPSDLDNPIGIFSRPGSASAKLRAFQELSSAKAAKARQDAEELQMISYRNKAMLEHHQEVASTLESIEQAKKDGSSDANVQAIWENTLPYLNSKRAELAKYNPSVPLPPLSSDYKAHDVQQYHDTISHQKRVDELLKQAKQDAAEKAQEALLPENLVKSFAKGVKPLIADPNFDPENLAPDQKQMLLPLLESKTDIKDRVPMMAALMGHIEKNKRLPTSQEYADLLKGTTEKETNADKGAPPDLQSAQNQIDALFDPKSKDAKVIAANQTYSKALNAQRYTPLHGANVVKEANELFRSTAGSEPYKEALAASNYGRQNPGDTPEHVHQIALDIMNSPDASKAMSDWGVNKDKSLERQVRAEMLQIQDDELKKGNSISPQNLTSQTRSLGEISHALIPEFDREARLLEDPKVKAAMGPLGSRWQEFMTGTIGTHDAAWTGLDDETKSKLNRLRVLMGFSQTGAARAHIGARGSGQMQAKFESLFNVTKMDSQTAEDSIKAAREYLSGYDRLVNRNNAIDSQKPNTGSSIDDIKKKHNLNY